MTITSKEPNSLSFKSLYLLKLVETNNEFEILNSDDIDYDLIFGILDKAIDTENHVNGNLVPELSKHSDDSTVTMEKRDTHSTSTSRVNVE